jgi:crossover junction endodeoxyribonuclease RusA
MSDGELSQEEAFAAAVAKGMFAGLVSKPETVRVVLPFPPSINRLYRAVGGRSILSEAYRLWKTEAGRLLNSQHPKKMLGKVAVTVELCAPDKRRRDADNAGTKAVLDLLVSHQIIEADDSRILRAITAKWVDAGEPCVVTVRAI